MPRYDFTLGGQLPLNRCPHCGIARPHISRQWGPGVTKAHGGENERHWSAFACQTCGGVLVAGSNLGQLGRVTEMYPEARSPDSALPKRARNYLAQAMESISAPSGAVMLAASAVDAMLKAEGLTEGSLYSRIDKAAADGVITDEMAAWAHDVRLDANDERHADEGAKLPNREDARRCVEFAEALGEFLFVLPARVKRGRENASNESE